MSRRKPTRPPIKKTTSDTLTNLVTGLGTSASKRSHSFFAYKQFDNWREYDAAYQSNWIARAIVDIPADDMTREWRTIKCEWAEQIRIAEDDLSVPAVVNEAISWARLYGGSAILMMTNQDFEKPLNVNKIKKGDLSRIIVFDRHELIPYQVNTWDVLAENYLQPEYYTVYQGNQRIHWSHFVRFTGAKLPRRTKNATQGWGDSEFRKCLDEIKDMVSAKDGVAELMQEANIDVITKTGLSEELATGLENKVEERYALFSQMKSIIRLALLDGEEKLDRMTLSLGGVAQVIEVFIKFICGAAAIPTTRLFGEQAKGLNNDGGGDLNNYYDNIRAKQNSQLDRPMKYLDQVLVRSAVGSMPHDFNWDWNPLYQPDRKEAAETAKIEAETDVILLDANVLKRSQVMRRLQRNETYQFEDKEILEIEEEERMSIEESKMDQEEKEEDE